MRSRMSRRAFAQLAALSTATIPLSARAAGPALDLDSAGGNLRAYVKLHTSLQKARIWYWYTGILEGTVADGPIVAVVAIDTLIRRDVSPTTDGRFEVEMFEANYFHALGDHTPRLRMVNPLNGREVAPFHYREGPHHVVYSEHGIHDRRAPPGSDAAPFAPRWHRAGDQIWTTNTFYIDAPYPLPLARWPLEGNRRERVGSFATLYGSYGELANPGLDTARCTFTYDAFMEWWPWMLMGQSPGQMLWHAGGRKLDSLDDIPTASRLGFETIHPAIFRERPWEELSMLGIDYPKLRTPTLR